MSDSRIQNQTRAWISCRVVRAARLGASVAMLGALIGSDARAGSITDWFSSLRAPAPDTLSPEPDTRTNGRLLNRWLTRDKSPFTTGSMDSSSAVYGEKGWESTKVVADPVSEAEFAAAKKIFDAKDYAKAEPLFKNLYKRVDKNPKWGPKALYFLGECQYQQKKYVACVDNFQILLKKFAGENEYKDRVIAREYEIANIWLAADDPKAKPLPFKARLDGREPVIDARGYAIKALENVRMHDQQGPLADHAALRTADHYHAAGDYEQAAIYYDQLLNDHKKSPLRERAQLSAIDARIKGYIGPEYDGSGLETARDLIKRTMEEFPENPANNEQLYHTLDLIEDQAAEHEYNVGLYYIRAQKPVAAEYQFGLVIAKWPKSKWAGYAKVQLKKTAKMPRKASVPSQIMTLPGAPDPGAMGGGQGGNGGGFGSSGGSSSGSPF